MRLRALAAAVLAVFLTSSTSIAAGGPPIGTSTAATEGAPWCLALAWMYNAGFVPNGVAVSMSFTQDLLSASQGLIAADHGKLAVDECVELGSIAQAWEKGGPRCKHRRRQRIRPAVHPHRSRKVERLSYLKGRTVAANGLQTTAAEAVVSILQHGANYVAGLDYQFVASGSASVRTVALLGGKIDAIPAVPPFSFELIDQGFPLLGVERQDVPNNVQGTLVVNRNWAAKNRPQLVAILKIMLQVGRIAAFWPRVTIHPSTKWSITAT